MNKRQAQAAEVLRNARLFLDARPYIAGSVNTSATRAEIDRTLASIEAFTARQAESHRRGLDETKARLELVERIRTHYLRPIVTIAHAFLRHPLDRLEVPAIRVNALSLLQYGKFVVDAVRPHAAVFVDNGLAPDFLVRLSAALVRLEESIAAGGTAERERRGSTAGLDQASRRARQLVGILNSLLASKLAEDSEARAAWQACKDVSGGSDEHFVE